MLSFVCRILLVFTMAIVIQVWSTGMSSAQEEADAAEPVVEEPEEEAVDPADFEETTPVVETILETDVDIGRVRVSSDGGDDRAAVSWARRRLNRNAGGFIEGCIASERERRAFEREDSPADGVEVRVTGEGTGDGPQIVIRELRGDLVLEGVCQFGLCTVRPRRMGSLDRGFANCIADEVASDLSGFPDPDREYGLRIPFRFRATETQSEVVEPEESADDAPAEDIDTPLGVE